MLTAAVGVRGVQRFGWISAAFLLLGHYGSGVLRMNLRRSSTESKAPRPAGHNSNLAL